VGPRAGRSVLEKRKPSLPAENLTPYSPAVTSWPHCPNSHLTSVRTSSSLTFRKPVTQALILHMPYLFISIRCCCDKQIHCAQQFAKKKTEVPTHASINKYSKPCLKRNAIVPVIFFRLHRFPFYKGLCFNKTKYKKYDRLGLQ
jgi:hypothetical protein